MIGKRILPLSESKLPLVLVTKIPGMGSNLVKTGLPGSKDSLTRGGSFKDGVGGGSS